MTFDFKKILNEFRYLLPVFYSDEDKILNGILAEIASKIPYQNVILMNIDRCKIT